jgi:hypothetical protein
MIVEKLLAVALAVASTNAICQSASQDDAATPKCSFSEVYNPDGWTIPGLAGAAQQGRAAVKDKPGYFVSSYQPIKAETFIPQDVSCPYNHPGRLVIENRPVRVVQLISWDYEGKLFMYEVFYALQVIYHGTRTELAAESQWQFFDVDGSGRFTVMRPVDRNPFAPEMIPDWVHLSTKPPGV